MWVNPNKVKTARLIRCLSMDQLLLRMEKHPVSKMTISKIERGLIKPLTQILTAIAEACMVPLDYFYQNDIEIGELEFRFKSGTSDKTRNEIIYQVLAAVQEYIELHSNIPDRIVFKNPLKGITVSNYTDIELAAERLRKKWNIGIQPIFSVYEMLQNYGIHILELDIENPDIIGLSTWVNKNIPIIVINSFCNKTTERKRFTALHELAHLLLRFKELNESEFAAYLQSLPQLPYKTILKLPDTERLCECFASAMLLPQQCLFRRFGQSRSTIHVDELVSVRQTYGISIAATIHRLQTLRVIDDSNYHRYFEEWIKPNPMESGMGDYAIKETADTPHILQLRLNAQKQ